MCQATAQALRAPYAPHFRSDERARLVEEAVAPMRAWVSELTDFPGLQEFTSDFLNSIHSFGACEITLHRL